MSNSSGWSDDPNVAASEAHAALIELARRQLTEIDAGAGPGPGPGPRVRYVNLAGTARSKEERQQICRRLATTCSGALQLTMELSLFYGDLKTSALPQVGLVILDPWLIQGGLDNRSEDEVDLIYEVVLAKSRKGLAFVLKSGEELAFTLTGARCSGGKRGMLLYPRSVMTNLGRRVLR